ncbi:protein LTO1 homolog [Scaptodrosophila lebanonensis]|uniref:Protein LTO1 homolog n=1 Tax=Drosophila lebanonensis TaxID=7225 RepID=A0A6J2T8F2_DROLE|nr:protein LTO1 homolog [Scaptodrosophila lebanonensis]
MCDPVETRDINDLFDDIVLTEEKHARLGFEEGLKDGLEQGNEEGYKLGYAQGVELGNEIGTIYGQVLAQLQVPHTSKVQRTLEQLRALIDQFPRTNDPEADIIGAVEQIRSKNTLLRALLRSKAAGGVLESAGRKDYSF